jgi:hypothetical protein
VLGDVARTEEEHGEVVRLAWSAKTVPPIIAEPMMPTPSETTMNMMVSTVPDWATFLEWEKALLHEAFRQTEGLKDLADRLFSSAKSPQAKLYALHSYLMTEIRYQQDYENHIAGVKPHAAPVVVERGYGDCKDKAVLFITLARLAGIQAHFALVRTRSQGPLRQDVPMQQFNHAIVYVPKQAGISAGRFYDPTADALDLEAIPVDDQGTTSLVLSPENGEWQWIPIPLSPASQNQRIMRARFTLERDGAAKGTLTVESIGPEASFYRRLARNDEQLKQALQMIVGHAYPGAEVTSSRVDEVKNLEMPALLALEVRSPTHGRVAGDELRVALPRVWSPETVFRLAERKYPFVVGPPMALEWQSEMELPPGTKVEKVPKSGTVDSACLTFVRQVKSERRRVVVHDRFDTKCERIAPEAYVEHRALMQGVVKMLQEELVIRDEA